MRIIKISAIWCSSCLVMNKVWNKVKEQTEIETLELDYDMDEEEVQKYQPGEILPVFIFEKNNTEVARIIGEVSVQELLDKIKELNV